MWWSWCLVGLVLLLIVMVWSQLQARREIRALVKTAAHQHHVNPTAIHVYVSWGWPFCMAVGFGVQVAATEDQERVQRMLQHVTQQMDERYGDD